jgi:hypothetical protein
MPEGNNMQSGQPLPKEIKYAQRTIYISVVLSIVGQAIFPFVALMRPTLITYIGYAVSVGEYLFLLFLGQQLRRLRLWVYITLIVLAILETLGSVVAGLNRILLPSQGLLRGSAFYQPYYYGSVIIVGVVNVILLYYLTRPVVYEAFQSARRSEVPGLERSALSRKVITILVVIASCLFIPGMVMVILAFLLAVWYTPPDSMNDSMTGMFANLLLAGIVLITSRRYRRSGSTYWGTNRDGEGAEMALVCADNPFWLAHLDCLPASSEARAQRGAPASCTSSLFLRRS